MPGAGSHPPLAYYVHGLPAWFYPSDLRLWTYPPETARDLSFVRSADIDRGNAILLDPRYDGELLLFLCRLANLAFAAPLLWCVWRWSCQLNGRPGGVVSLAVASLSPNLLAHGSLITTDFPLAAAFVGAAYGLRVFLRCPTWTRLGLAGVLGGLALLTKLSALLWVPVCAALLALAAAWGERGMRDGLARLLPASLGSSRSAAAPFLGAAVAGAALLAIAAAVVFAGFGLRLSPYATVVRSQLWDLASGHEAFLLGRYSARGWWYYFPVALLVKTPLPTLALAAGGVACLLGRRGRRWETLPLMLPPALFFAAFMASAGKDLGLRYVLPVYPFLSICAGAVLQNGWAGCRRWRRLAVAGLVAGLALGTLRNHPHHLAYFNELAGGPDGGRHFLVDSNLDWGQDLKGLKAWMDERGLQRVKLSYFGTVDPALYGLDYTWLPSYLLPRRDPSPVTLPTTGMIAISATNLAGVYMEPYGHGRRLFAWLEAFRPVARIGHSILVFHVPEGAFSQTPAAPR